MESEKPSNSVVTQHEVIEAKAIPPTHQKAELIALTRPLEVSQNKIVNIWKDLKFALGVVHAHGAIWKQRAVNIPGIPCETWTNNPEIVREGAATLKGGINALLSSSVWTDPNKYWKFPG